MSHRALWYFDVISPYAYLHLKQFTRLPADLAIEFRPVLFAGLLKHWGTKGPAELPAKRLHTYRQAVWFAHELGVPFRMPPRHPFNPLKVLRLIIGLGASRAVVETAFDVIWGEGHDPDHDWPALCARLGVAPDTPLINDPQVKATLARNTDEAAAAGLWGVPSFLVEGEIFWGADTVSLMNAFLADPALFEREDLKRAATAEIGAERRIPAPGG